MSNIGFLTGASDQPLTVPALTSAQVAAGATGLAIVTPGGIVGSDGNLAAGAITPAQAAAVQALVSGAGNSLQQLRLASTRPCNKDASILTLPTITVGVADAASSISGAVYTAWNDARLTYSTRVAVLGATYPNNGYSTPVYMDTGMSGGAVYMAGLMASFSFSTEATIFELPCKGYSLHRLWFSEDGRQFQACAVQLMSSTGSNYQVNYNFGGIRKPRRIVVEYSTSLGGPTIGPTESVYAWAPTAPLLVVFGDSFVEGAGAGNNYTLDGFAVKLGHALGCLGRTIASGIGSTGYVATNGGAKKNAVQCVQTNVIDNLPSNWGVVVHCHGINDSSSVSVNAAAVFDAIYAAKPYVQQILFMPFQPRSIDVSARRTELLAVAATRPWLTVIDNTGYGTDPEITGTGSVNATTGTGNSDWVISSDNTHPVEGGHSHIAEYRDAKIRYALTLTL